MAEETTISTPEVTADDVTTSNVDVTDDVTTSTDEVTNADTTAETGTENGEEPKLYAGKYKTIEDFEKGYAELNKVYTQNQQIQSKYNELLKQQEAQQAIQLEKAKQNGFNTVAEQEINDRLIAEEFTAYANAINAINPENYEAVRSNLLNYYSTANRAYLDEAKRYYPSEFIENIAVGKKNLAEQLKREYDQKAEYARAEKEKALADNLKADFADFLADIKENAGKANVLKRFCDYGFINSKDDMQNFVNDYNNIIQAEKEKAIAEYKAQQAIEQTKAKAVIDGNSSTFDINSKPKSADISKMSQKEFDDYCKKYGTDWIYA